jgi:hypothetical protein
MIFVLGI